MGETRRESVVRSRSTMIPLSSLPLESLLFLVLDLALLFGGGVFALRLRDDPASGPQSFNSPVFLFGAVALLRGLYRLAFLPSRLGFLGTPELPSQVYASAVVGIVATVVLPLLGLLLAYRPVALRLGNQNPLLRVGESLHKLRTLLGVTALLLGAATLLPYLPASSGGGRYRRRRW